MTEEDCINYKYNKYSAYINDKDERLLEAIYEAMRLHALDFSKWAIANGYRINNTYIAKWYRIRKAETERLTTEQLYELYLQSQLLNTV